MGPQLFPADNVRTISAEFSVRPSPSPTGESAGGFLERLENERSHRRAERPDRGEGSRRSEEKLDADAGEAPPTDRQDERPDQATEASPEAAVSVPVPDALPSIPSQLVEASPEASPAQAAGNRVDAERPVTLNEARVPEQSAADLADPPEHPGPSARDRTAPPVPASEAGGEPRTEEPASSAAPRGVKPAVLPGAAERSAADLVGTRGSAESQAVDVGKGVEAAQRATPETDERSPVRQEHRANGPKANEDEAQRAAARPEKRTDVTRHLPNGETIQDRKLKDSIEQRRRGSADDPRPRAGSRRSGRGGASVRAVREGPQRLGPRAYEAVAESIKPVAIRGALGDSAAASVARFLLSGAEGPTGSAGATDGAIRTASHGPGGPAVATVGPPSGGAGGSQAPSIATGWEPVPQLVSGVDGPDGLAGAARVLSASNGSGRFQITMQLEPPELGQLKLRLHMDQQAMTLHVDVQTREVAKLIESRLSELREALAVHGIRVDRMDVVVRSAHAPDAGPQHQDSGQTADGGADHPANDGSAAWTSDGERMDTARDQGSAGEGAAGGRPDEMLEDARGDRTTEHEAIEMARTTELSLDVVA